MGAVISISSISDQLYCKNMAALFRVDARLAQRVDEYIDDGSVVVEASKRGAATVSVRVADDKQIYLHSRVDPEDEAKRLAEGVDVGEDFCYIVGGFGLGHHVKALRARLKGEAFLIVTEPNLLLLRAAMETVDLADIFANDRCIILTTADKGEVQSRLEPHNTLMMMGAQFVSHPASDRVAGEFQAAMRKLIADHMTFCRMSLVTLVANSRITCKNVANNLPTYVSTPPIDVLRDRFKGCPGIVVSAGPSLRRNIDQLAKLKGKAVIIAVQTTYKMLLNHGIVPDFVTSLDYHEMSKRFFEGIDDFSGTHLVAEPKATWHVIDTFDGRVSLLDNSWARLCLGNALAGRAGLKAGATVAHLAFYLAVYMGCEPIVMVGQDLGYTDHVYYVPGVAMHDLWRPELNRFNTMEMREWERIVRTRQILMKVKDLEGREIYTDEQLFTYLQQFEGDFAAVPGRVIDATEGGVRKANTRVMSLAEVAKQFCEKPIPAERFGYGEKLNWRDRSRLEKGRQELAERIKEAGIMTETCREMLELLRELTTLLDKPAVFNRRIVEVDALRLRVREQDRVYQMVSAVSQHAELQRFSADRRLGLADLSSVERAGKQLERDIRFVEAMLEGTEAVRGILEESCSRFDEAIGAWGLGDLETGRGGELV